MHISKNKIFSILYLVLVLAIALPTPSYAQLAGSDTAAGDSCAGIPTGATRMSADADSDGGQVTLVCNGTTWESESIVAASKAGGAPAADGGSGSSIWLSSSSDIYYSSGNVGIGTTNPIVALSVVGDINYTGTLVDVSDIRMKYDIEPFDSPLHKLTTLNGFSFKMKGDENQVIEYGVSAQDVQQVFPELVHVIDPATGTLGVSYSGLIAPMIEAMKEQQAEIEALREEIEILKAEQNKANINKPGEL